MKSFDRESWLDKASKRAIAKSLPKKTYHSCVDDLEQVITWCEKNSIEVVFSNTEGVSLDTINNIVEINSTMNVETQMISLLHECGHFLVGGRLSEERYGMGYSESIRDPKIVKRKIHKVDIVDEEMEAWARGWKLACRLELSVDKDQFDTVRTGALMSYFKWALKK